MKRMSALLLLIMLFVSLTACSGSATGDMTEADSANASVVLAQDIQPTTTIAAADNEKDADTDEEIIRPEGWSEETHDKSADPNYNVVFPQDEVNRIDFVVDPADWQVMLDDMTVLYGEAGTQTGGMDGGQMGPGDDAPPRGQPGKDPIRPSRDTPEGQAYAGDQPRPDVPDGQPLDKPGGGGMLGSSSNPTYVPVTVEFEDETWTNVGLRFKGNSSLKSTWSRGDMKLPLRLDFDQFEVDYPEIDDQRFYGFEQLTFSSGFSDASYLRDKVTADIFREAGVPAAQTAFYEVYIDYGEGPVYFGLYTLVEVVDDTVIETQFEDDDGNVYKPEGNGASFTAGTFSEVAFEKQTNQDEADWSDIQAIFNALHADTRTSDPATWRSDLEAVFDVDGFLNWLAVNTVVQNWDTYGAMEHNYYLYHDPTTDQIVWIPWDNNMALSSSMGRQNVPSFSMDEVSDKWPLIRYLMDDEGYYSQYVAYVDAVINTAFEPSKMETTYRELAILIEPYALSENAEHTLLSSEADFYTAIEELVEHAYARYDAATKFITSQQ